MTTKTVCELATADQKNFFFDASSVYNQDLYTTLVVVVNACTFLWTSRLTAKKSAVYAQNKPVHYSAKFLMANLDKIFACEKTSTFAQTIPVDIQHVIHRRPLDFRSRSGKLCQIELRTERFLDLNELLCLPDVRLPEPGGRCSSSAPPASSQSLGVHNR